MQWDLDLFKETVRGLEHLGYDSIIVEHLPNAFTRWSFRPSVALNPTLTAIMHDRVGSNHVYYDLPHSNNLRLTWEDFYDRFVLSKTKRLLKHIRSLNETENSL